MNSFFAELRRRKVYRAVAGYGVAAWFLIQLAAVTFPAWELPNWSLRLVIVLLLAAFPFVLIFAWAFEISATGVHHTAPADETEAPNTRPIGRNALLLLAIFGLVVSVAIGAIILPRIVLRKVEKSIAVLPFDNLSPHQENAYFADGVQDDILTNLARISDLKVISRTSVTSYRGKSKNIRQIARELGVSTILEGSVQRDNDRVRVNVQLIDAYNDRHLWAQNYERNLTDVFAIQSELAQSIASALKAKLSPDEQQRIATKPTENGEAYSLYIAAHEIFNRPDRHHDDVARAEALYERAIELDPSFALAHARLSHLESWTYYAIDPTPLRMEKARRSARQALQLRPDLAEAHLALGLVHYYLDHDYQHALEELAMARNHLPNDAVIARIIAAIQRRQGDWSESNQSYARAAAVDPKDPILLENMGWNFIATRQYNQAARVLDRALKVSPQVFTIRELRARAGFYDKGDLGPLGRVLESTPETPDPNGTILLTRYNYEMYRRNFEPLLGFLKRSNARTSRGETSAPIPNAFLQGNVYAALKDEAAARIQYQEARQFVESKVQENPADGPRHALLGLIYAGLGKCAEATQEVNRAIDLLPEQKDAFDGPILTVTKARVCVSCGDLETALRILEHSIQMPAGITVPELQLDPTWEPLRSDERFQRLINPSVKRK